MFIALSTNLFTNIPNDNYCGLNTQAPKFSSNVPPDSMPIRLIILHQDKKFSNIQWEAISALESHKEWITTSEQLDISSDNARIQLVKDLTKQEVSEIEIQDLYWWVG